MDSNLICIRGAKEHNLKNVDIDIPKNKFIVITGVSGSGKSSLAFDTIYAEGRRRYIESLSSYARQFESNSKPNVESITGLSPAIAIDQKTSSRNPRSTVATVTEIYDYMSVPLKLMLRFALRLMAALLLFSKSWPYCEVNVTVNVTSPEPR